MSEKKGGGGLDEGTLKKGWVNPEYRIPQRPPDPPPKPPPSTSPTPPKKD